MDSIQEVIVISDSANQSTNCSIYDLKTGGLITTFKEGNSGKKCLSLIGHDYIISALNNQPGLRVWILNKNLPDMCKMTVSGLVTSLAVSNCGMYCVAGIDRSFCVWEVSTGILLSSVQHHSQAITCLKFSSDGSHLISGGKDGMVLVWLLSELISASDSSDNVKPRFVWIHHAAEITDIYLGSLGIFARVVTASRDMTCRIYELETEHLLTTIHVDFSITAVTMDESEYFLILGSSEGNIYRINMFAANTAEIQYDSSDKKCAYLGHEKEITCLSVSTTGKYLVSGSEDHECRIWDLMNFSCIRKIDFLGPITNAFITLLPPGLKTESQYFPRLKVSTFKRHYETEDTEIEYVTSKIQSKKLSLMHLGTPDEYFDSRVLNCSEDSLIELNKNNLSQEMMAVINNQMYAYALCESYDQPDDSESQIDDSD